MANQTTPAIQIKDSNVGIGTTSPSSPFTVATDVRAASLNAADLRPQSQVNLLGGGGDSLFIGQLTNSFAYIQSSYFNTTLATYPILLNPLGGNVLIGTTTDNGDKLQVSGNTTINGSLYLRGGSRSIVGDGGDLFIDTENVAGRDILLQTQSGQNVGIGTTSPGAKLDVNGEVYVSPNTAGKNTFVLTTNASNDGRLLIKSDTTTNVDIQANGTTYFNGGNVAIGTTTAATKLTVNSGSTVAASRFTNTTTGLDFILGTDGVQSQYTNIVFYSDSGNAQIWKAGSGYSSQGGASSLNIYNSNGAIAFHPNSVNNAMFINTSGNVGIGTTAPGYTLQVGSTSANSSMAIIGNSTAGIEVRTNSAGGRIAALEQYFGSEGSLWLYLSNTTKVLLRADGNSYLNGGNVGIGTTSPGSLLSVGDSFATIPGITVDTGNTGNSAFVARKTASKPAFGILPWDANVYLSAGIYYDGNSWIQNSNGTNNLLFDLQPGTGVNWYASNDSSDSWNVASAVNLWDASGQWTSTVKSTRTGNSYFTGGNVGIGTTNPASKLHIDNAPGSDVISISDAAGSVRLSLGQESSYTGNYIDSRNIDFKIKSYLAGGSGGNIFFQTGTGTATTKVTVNVDGNVGIGTTSPSQILHVYGSASTPMIESTTVGANANLRFKTTARTWSIGPNQALSNSFFEIYDSTASATRVTIDTSGNVGIGTTSPGEKLHVDGSVVVTYNNSYQGINSVGNKAILARVSPTTGIINYAEYATATNLNGFVMGSDDARVKGNIATDSLEFITNASERMRITSAGKVGIGTSSPSNILHITDVMRMDNVSAYSPNLSSTSAPKYGYGDVSNERYLAEPVIWLKIDVDGTEYVIPGYTEVI